MYVFYADIFIVQNFLMNEVALLAAARLQKIRGKTEYILLTVAAFAGSILEFLFLVLGTHYALFVFFSYTIVLPFITAVGLRTKGWRNLLKSYVFCLLAMILTGGMAQAMENSFGIRRLPFLVIFTISLTTLLFLEFWVRFRKISAKLLPVFLDHGDKTVQTLALYDSGNRLKEPYAGRAVHIISPEIAKFMQVSDGRVIPYCALGGAGLLVIYTIDRIRIREPGLEKTIEPAVIGVAAEELMKDKSYKLILNQEVDIV